MLAALLGRACALPGRLLAAPRGRPVDPGSDLGHWVKPTRVASSCHRFRTSLLRAHGRYRSLGGCVLASVLSLVCFILVGCGGAREPSRTPRGAAPESPPATAANGPSHSPTAANGPVVLGSKNFIVWGGKGFGIPHPTTLVVGGDPSVQIARIHWHGWGRWRAWGVGSYAAPQFGRGGGYYRKRFRALLRVSGIGRCHPNGPRTYMSLKVKVALQPGQRPSWYEAAGGHGLCSYP